MYFLCWWTGVAELVSKLGSVNERLKALPFAVSGVKSVPNPPNELSRTPSPNPSETLAFWMTGVIELRG
jgi:hypothetical protein